jgi:spore coat protein A, manganese oxidase
METDPSQCTPTYPVGNFINPVILDPNTITKYVTNLPIPIKLKPCEIEDPCCDLARGDLAKGDLTRDDLARCDGCVVNFYTIEMKEIIHKLHPDIPPTKFWIYDDLSNHECRSTSNNKNAVPVNPLIVAERYHPVNVKWINNLPTKHLLEVYIDHTLDGADFPAPDVRNVVHLHGGIQAPTSDGNPNDWYTPGQYKIFNYPVYNPPTMLFWHDHASAITRLNVYAGLSGGVFIIRDEKIESKLNLPTGKYEIPLVITDRTFDIEGQLVYSTSNSGPMHPKWNSSFLGNTISVNNAVWPKLSVRPNKYRFRIVNSSDTRTYSLKLVYANNMTVPGPAFYQIGTDEGYLPRPVILNDPFDPKSPQLILAIAERADIIIDFSNFEPGTEFIMINTANAPFPNGNPPNPNTVGQVMKIIVKKLSKEKHFCAKTPKKFHRLNPSDVSVIRQLQLEVDTTMAMQPNALYLENLGFMKPVSERPLVGATEMWEFVNVTAGMHPMHIHLIDFQLLNRQKFDVNAYVAAVMAANPNLTPGNGIPNKVSVTPFLLGPPVSPLGTNEDGNKDVIRANGGEVTRLIMKFLPNGKKKYPFDPTKGQFVWHCHLLSHEDNDMMRPMQVCWGIN